jgi:hypothetical protein
MKVYYVGYVIVINTLNNIRHVQLKAIQGYSGMKVLQHLDKITTNI